MKVKGMRVLSLVLAVCMLLSLLPMAGAFDPSANDGKAIYRYNQNAMLVKAYTNVDVKQFTTIWNTAEGHSLNKASQLWDSTGTAPNGTYPGPWNTHKTDPFHIMGKIGGATTVGGTRGDGVIGCAGATAANPGGYRMRIILPFTDTYSFESHFYTVVNDAAANEVTMYIAPVDAADPLAEEYKIGTVSGMKATDSSQTNAKSLFRYDETKTLEAGEYFVSYVAPGSFWYGSLSLYGTKAPKTTTLTADVDELKLAIGGSATINLSAADDAGNPIDLTDAVGRVDSSVSGVTGTFEDGKVTVEASYAAEGTGSITVLVTVDDTASWIEIPITELTLESDTVYTYKIREAVKAMTPADGSLALATSAFLGSYDASQDANVGSAPWQVDAATNANASYSTGNDKYGVFLFSTKGADGPMVRFKIRVEENGEYRAKLTHRQYQQSTPADIYIAPIKAGDPLASQYLALQVTKPANLTSTPVEATALSGQLQLVAGEYYVSFVQRGAGNTTQRYLTVDYLQLIKTADLELVQVERITINQPNSTVVPASSTLQLSATVSPTNAYEQIPDWSSSDETIATVSPSGVVTPVGQGRVTITATAADESGVSDSIDLIIGDPKYSYKIREAVKALHTTSDTLVLTASKFLGNYAASQDANVGSDPWQVDAATTANISYSTGNDKYGVFFFSSAGYIGPFVRLKIQVTEDGAYIGALNNTLYGSSCTTDIYVAPIRAEDPMADKYHVQRVTVPSSIPSGVTARCNLSEVMQLEAGEYYVTFVQDAQKSTERYLTVDNLQLYRVGELGVSEIELDHDLVYLPIGGVDFLSETVYPTHIADKSLTWASENDAVATVENGLIVAQGAGHTTITATAASGASISAHVLVTDATGFRYAFDKGWYGEGGAAVYALAEMTYEKTVLGHPKESVSEFRTIETDPWEFYASRNATALVGGEFPQGGNSESLRGRGYQIRPTDAALESSVTFAIMVPKDGLYVPNMILTRGSRFGTADVYLAPIDVIVPTAAKYQIGTLDLNADATTDQQEQELSAVELSAGEYLLTVKGKFSTLWLTEFVLDDPSAVGLIRFEEASKRIAVGATETLSVTVLPETAENKAVTFASNNEEAVTVNAETGEIFGVADGMAVITATLNADPSKSDTIVVFVGDYDPSVSDVTVSTVNGAQIRTSGVQGLRFISSIDKTAADYGKVVEYGTVLLPTEDLAGDDQNLVIGYENNGHAVVKVKAERVYSEDDNAVTYTAVITNIKEANYARKYSARAYAIFEDAAGEQHVVYSETVASRSIYDVAVRALEDPNVSEEMKEVFRAIVAAVEAE